MLRICRAMLPVKYLKVIATLLATVGNAWRHAIARPGLGPML